MIQVIAKIELVESQKDAFLKYFAALISQVRAEKGCIEYTPMVDFSTTLDRQERIGKNAVVIIEKWESIEALETHLIAPHMLDYRKATKAMVVGMTLQILEPVFEPNESQKD